jgi:hypothetical protein
VKRPPAAPAAIIRGPMADKLTEPLLTSSFAYVKARHEFETAITAARHKGWSDEQIATATGLTVQTVELVAGERST